MSSEKKSSPGARRRHWRVAVRVGRVTLGLLLLLLFVSVLNRHLPGRTLSWQELAAQSAATPPRAVALPPGGELLLLPQLQGADLQGVGLKEVGLKYVGIALLKGRVLRVALDEAKFKAGLGTGSRVLGWRLLSWPAGPPPRLQPRGDGAQLELGGSGRYLLELRLQRGDGRQQRQQLALLAAEREDGSFLLSRLDDVTPLCEPRPPTAIELRLPGGQWLAQRDDWLPARLRQHGGQADARLKRFVYPSARSRVRVRGRGNSTWLADKKPFVLKAAKGSAARPLHGQVFLANYFDPSGLRNALAFCAGRALHRRSWTPTSFPAELIVNGRYEGLYEVAQPPRSGRQAIDLKAARGVPPDGLAFLIETLPSERAVDLPHVKSLQGRHYRLRGGSAAPEAVRDFINQLEQALEKGRFDAAAADWYGHWLDIESAQDHLLLAELFKDNDSFWASTYFHKRDGGKLRFGPLWDFDLALGNYGQSQVAAPEGWYVRHLGVAALLWADPAFRAGLRARHAAVHARLPALLAYLYAQGELVRPAVLRDVARWGIRNTVYDNQLDIRPGEHPQAQLDYLASWLLRRAFWLAQALAAEEAAERQEPEVVSPMP